MHLAFFGLGFISVFELVLSLDLVLDLYWGFLNKLYIFDVEPYSYTLIIILDLRLVLVVWVFLRYYNKFDAKIIIFVYRFFLDLDLRLVIYLCMGLTDCAAIY